jgi:APA family basic amino acid/polyamine antiporter
MGSARVDPDRSGQPTLVRALGPWDVTAITAGTILGSAIFLAAAFVPREVPHPALVLLLWVAGGLIAIAGALSYAELGAMLPEAGGQYHYLKQAFGPLAGFLFGWTSLLAIQSGGIAYLAVAFGQYLGAFFPFFSPDQVVASVAIGPWTWQPNTAQLAGVVAIAVLSTINYFGVRQGARVQGYLTVVKVASLMALIVAGLWVPANATPEWTAPLPSGNLLVAGGLAMVAVLGNFDGWYQATLSAGEIKRPERNLPLGMVGGTVLVLVIYLLVNWVYLRAMPLDAIGGSERIGEEATTALLGPTAGRLMAGAVLVSVLGGISSSMVGPSRISLPMAQDGVFFPQLARIHPRYRTPTGGIVLLGVWSSILVVSGSYEQLFDYSLFASFLFHAATGAAIIRLRRSRPDLPRPYRVVWYPWVPVLFVTAMVGLIVNTMIEKPTETGIGIGLVGLGVAAYYALRRAYGKPVATDRRS